MIVQSAPTGEAHFVITQVDHARACGQLAAAFGNDTFAALEPREPLAYLVAHHDEGWAALDEAALLDPATRLPYHLTKTPILRLIATGSASPDHNEAHHPLSGLLSSMHTWGLYHGRYGLSDKIFIHSFPAEHRPAVDAMLAGEQARQARLKAALPPEWARDDVLFHHYKLLQFFDTLGLYFHTTHAAQRGVGTFQNVPRAVGDDVVVTVTPLSETAYRVTPYPFGGAQVTMTTRGRWLHPLADDAPDARAALAAADAGEQSVMLVA